MNPNDRLSFLDIFNAIPDVMGLQDTERRILMYNEAGYRYVGLSPDEVKGKYCYEVIGRDAPCAICATREAIETGKPTSITKYVPENGTWLNVRAYPIRDGEGNIHQVVEHLRDITESKALQLELENLNRNLEKQVEARTLELQALVDDLTATRDQLIESEKLSALGRMVAGFSHEINTPLGVAITSASFISEQIHELGLDEGGREQPEELPEGFLQNLSHAGSLVNRNLSRAADLITGFKRIAADQTSEQKRTINLHEYLDDLILSMHHELTSNDVSIRVSGEEDLTISTYPGALSQVVSNLIMNTLVHAYPDGGHGEVSIEITGQPDSMITVIYEDDGCGMEPETLKRLYEPFYTTRIGGDGIGLGMNIVYNQVIGKLDGRITCESSPGNGTRFTLSLPDLQDAGEDR